MLWIGIMVGRGHVLYSKLRLCESEGEGKLGLENKERNKWKE